MPVSNLLQRLRPAGAPGTAGPVAVPAKAEDGPAAELAPVFEALASVISRCDAIRTAAEEAAAAEAASAQRDAATVISDATSRAPAERAAAAARVHQVGDAAADALVVEAQTGATRLEAEGRQRLIELTGVVLSNLRATIAASTQRTSADR